MSRPAKKREAFTLLEVMVAVAILAVSAVSISRGIATTLRMQKIIRESVKTAWACEAALTRLAVSGQFNFTGTQDAVADTKYTSVSGELLNDANDPNRIVTLELKHPASSDPDPTIKAGSAGKEVYPLKVKTKDPVEPSSLELTWAVQLKKTP